MDTDKDLIKKLIASIKEKNKQINELDDKLREARQRVQELEMELWDI